MRVTCEAPKVDHQGYGHIHGYCMWLLFRNGSNKTMLTSFNTAFRQTRFGNTQAKPPAQPPQSGEQTAQKEGVAAKQPAGNPPAAPYAG